MMSLHTCICIIDGIEDWKCRQMSIDRSITEAYFVALLEVVNEVEEGGAVKGGAERPVARVGGGETSEPVVGHHDGGQQALLAEELEGCLCEQHNSAQLKQRKTSKWRGYCERDKARR